MGTAVACRVKRTTSFGPQYAVIAVGGVPTNSRWLSKRLGFEEQFIAFCRAPNYAKCFVTASGNHAQLSAGEVKDNDLIHHLLQVRDKNAVSYHPRHFEATVTFGNDVAPLMISVVAKTDLDNAETGGVFVRDCKNLFIRPKNTEAVFDPEKNWLRWRFLIE